MRFALIGYGAWGGHHARAIASTPGLELVAIACRNEATAQQARNDFPGARVTTRYQDILAMPEVDVVDIVVPNYLHAEIGCACLEAGKDVLLEKPMAVTVADCDRLVAAAEASGRVLSIGHEFRLSTQWGRVKSLIDEGRIGTPRFVNINLFRNHYRTGADGWRYQKERVGSWVLEEAIHFFDFALWYMEAHGDPVRVSAHGTLKDGAEGMYDNFTARVVFESGAYANITQCIAGFQHHLTVEVTGDAGACRAYWSGAMDRDEKPAYDLLVRDRDLPFERGVREAEVIKLEPSGEVFELKEEIRLTAQALRNRQPLVAPQEARKRVLLCLAAEESAAQGRELALDFGARA